MGCARCKDSDLLAEMSEEVVFKSLTQTKNDSGGYEVVRTTFDTVMARVRPKHGKEELIAQRIDVVNMYEITIRYLPGLKEEMEALWDGKTLQIKSVIPLRGKKEFMSILAIDEGPGT